LVIERVQSLCQNNHPFSEKKNNVTLNLFAQSTYSSAKYAKNVDLEVLDDTEQMGISNKKFKFRRVLRLVNGLMDSLSIIFDEKPFEYDFFLRISQSFPFIKKLTLINMKPQNNKRCRELEDDNQGLSITEYPHLTTLDLIEAHKDYIELFLIDKKTCLPNSVDLYVVYQAMRRVTDKFTRNATRINCVKLRALSVCGKYRIPKYVKEYFPHTEFF
jgi:hypothetical protein